MVLSILNEELLILLTQSSSALILFALLIEFLRQRHPPARSGLCDLFSADQSPELILNGYSPTEANATRSHASRIHSHMTCDRGRRHGTATHTLLFSPPVTNSIAPWPCCTLACARDATAHGPRHPRLGWDDSARAERKQLANLYIYDSLVALIKGCLIVKVIYSGLATPTLQSTRSSRIRAGTVTVGSLRNDRRGPRGTTSAEAETSVFLHVFPSHETDVSCITDSLSHV